MTRPERSLEPGSLVVRTDWSSHVVSPRSGMATIGRDPHAQVQLDDTRISRMHVRLEFDGNGWRAVDTSMNGMFLGNSRAHSVTVTDGMAIRLGDPVAGPVVRFEVTPGVPLGGDVDDADATNLIGPGGGEDDETVSLDPGMVRAGAAAAARRRELDISQRSLAGEGIINAGALIAFEKGRSWPRERTRAKLEEVLRWPPGTIAQIRQGTVTASAMPAASPTPPPSDAPTVTSSTTIPTGPAPIGGDEASLITQAVETAVSSLSATIDALPPLDDPDFTARVSAILADLRRLEGVAAGATRIGRVTPTLIKVLSTVRRELDELTLLAANAPGATLGQRAYAARRRANLTIGETAQAVGITEETLAQVEADQPVPPGTAAQIEDFLQQLA